MLSLPQRPAGAIANLFARGVGDAGITHVLRIIRKQLGMDVAFVSRFRTEDRVFEHVDADGPAPIHVGQTIPLHDGYCQKVVRGELPELIPDTSAVPAAMEIYELDAKTLVGVECLARFDIEPQRGPDKWFDGAREAGVQLELELHAIRNAIIALDGFPPEVYLGINSSPELILSGQLAPVLAGLDASRIVLEITEHATVTDYDALIRALRPMRERGVRIAVDDAGAGYASMRHILNLKCEIIKLDMSLTRDIDTDPGRRALARGLISFACDIGSDITAEGIETRGELEVLRKLGVHKAQGFYLSRPGSMEDALKALRIGCPALAAASGL